MIMQLIQVAYVACSQLTFMQVYIKSKKKTEFKNSIIRRPIKWGNICRKEAIDNE